MKTTYKNKTTLREVIQDMEDMKANEITRILPLGNTFIIEWQ